uniref:Putative ovule protein n=1 Tax=Solanum chacoense TaxID=4108 RepID=A0A0V0I3P5_SOLCH
MYFLSCGKACNCSTHSCNCNTTKLALVNLISIMPSCKAVSMRKSICTNHLVSKLLHIWACLQAAQAIYGLKHAPKALGLVH